MARVTEGEEREKYVLLLDVLTPVAKSYPSEMGIVSVSQALQCLGGYGYCDEFPIEQFYRDARIHPIHEGTTGIQGLDLLGRKVRMKDGRGFKLFMLEVMGTIEAADKIADLRDCAERLRESLEKLRQVTDFLLTFAAKGDIELFLADSTLYLELFGIAAVGWQWLLQGITAHAKLLETQSESESTFYRGKLWTMKYFFHYEMPKTEGLTKRLLEADGLTVQMDPELFTD